MVQAVIYDMDGIIIDSEPLWREAEIQSFALVGIGLTDDMCRQVTGLRVDEVVKYWFDQHPVDSAKAKYVENQIWENIVRLVNEKGLIKEGVIESLEFFKSKGIKIGMASSSAMVLINTVLNKLDIRHFFQEVQSGEFEEFGKPHPGVYITVSKKLGVPATTCVAIEDSINGILAAKSAKMKCIAIPEDHTDQRLGIADFIQSSLLEIDENLWKKLSATS